jgi:multicomponent Na+:H+ antiporter subunit C
VSFLPYAVAVWLFIVGLYGLITSRSLVHLTVCLTVVQSATYVVLLAIGYRDDATAPVFTGISTEARAVDPVVHALTFIDVIVEAVVAGLLLAIAIQVQKRYGTIDPEHIDPLRG